MEYLLVVNEFYHCNWARHEGGYRCGFHPCGDMYVLRSHACREAYSHSGYQVTGVGPEFQGRLKESGMRYDFEVWNMRPQPRLRSGGLVLLRR
jgi:hypothetical protein